MFKSSIMAALFTTQAVAEKIQPPTKGKFFYADFELDNDKGFHDIKMKVSQQKFKMMVNTIDGQLGLFDKSCDSCGSNDKYTFDDQNPKSSKSGVMVSTTEKMYSGKGIKDISFHGEIYNDEFNINFSQTGLDAFFDAKFIDVTSASDGLSSHWGGFVGIAPYTSEPDQKERNFMYQLRSTGKIDHNTVSFYIDLRNTIASSIKFGSYDASGIASGASMALYKTADKTRWSVKGQHLKANGHKVAENREVQFDMQLPYLYIPDDDFTNFAVSMAIFDTKIKCSSRDNSCKYKTPCSQVNQNRWYLSMDFYDDDTRNNYALPSNSNFLFDGDSIGDPGTCYLPVFKSGASQDVWYMGNLFMNYFYLTFDMSPYDEQGKDYITIGVSPRNPYSIIPQTGGGDDPSPPPPVPPTPVPPTPVPPTPVPPTPVNPDDKNDTTGNDTKPVNPVKPDDGGGAIITPGGDPDENGVEGWLSQNKIWLIVVSILILLIILCLIYWCTRKGDDDPYFAKQYSVVDDTPLKVKPNKKAPVVEHSPNRNSGVIN